jgi:hypothetical protein
VAQYWLVVMAITVIMVITITIVMEPDGLGLQLQGLFSEQS